MVPIVTRMLAISLLVVIAHPSYADEPIALTPSVGKHIMIAPEDIEWGPCPPFLPPGGMCTVIEGDPQVPNALFTLRSKLPDNYKIAPHFHPTDEHITVISGTFAMGLGKAFDEKALKPMRTGSFMVMPKGAPHFALTRGETIVQVHAVGPMIFSYINPEDDPASHTQ